MDALRRQIDEAFGDLTAPALSDWMPATELYDTEDALVLRMQLPGFDRDSLDIKAMRQAVEISGRRSAPERKGNFHRSEFRYGEFSRQIGLPVPVQNDRVEADYRDGILTLTLPKTEEVRNRVVKVDLNAIDGSGEAPALEADAQGADDR